MGKKDADLTLVLKLLSEDELRILSNISATQDLIRKEIQQLISLESRVHSQKNQPLHLEPCQLAGADETWLYWVKSEIRAKNCELAKTKALFEEQRQRCLLSFGRKSAFSKLVGKQNGHAQQTF